MADRVASDPVTTAAGPDQSQGTIDRPDSEPATADAGVDQAPGVIERPEIEPDSVVMSGGSTMARGDLLDDDITAVRAATPEAPRPEPQASATVQPVDPEPVAEPVIEHPVEPEPTVAPIVEPVAEQIVIEEPIIEPLIEIEAEPVAPVEPEPILEPEPDLLDDQG